MRSSRRFTAALAITLCACVSGGARTTLPAAAAALRGAQVLEIRSHSLKPGMRGQFHQLFLREALPMLRRRRIAVVAYGPSLHDEDSLCRRVRRNRTFDIGIPRSSDSE